MKNISKVNIFKQSKFWQKYFWVVGLGLGGGGGESKKIKRNFCSFGNLV